MNTVIPNGINTRKIDSIKKVNNSSIPSLFLIGSANQNWHGIDKIEKLAKLTQGKLMFHIIGMDKDTKNTTLPDNIIFHGYMNEEMYNKLISEFDIGIGTLALHRNNMTEACPLKVREYLCKGFPVLIGYKEVFPTNNQYILQISNNENNIETHINEIIEFCYKNKNTVVDREVFLQHIDSNVLETKRLQFFNEVIKKV